MSGCGLHRHGKRKRRHLGQKPSFLARMEQSRKDKGLAPMFVETFTESPSKKRSAEIVEVKEGRDPVSHPEVKNRKGFLRSIFNRKTGG